MTSYTSFHYLINVYSRRSGSDRPRGQNFDVYRNPKFQNKNLFEVWFNTFLFMILYMYIAPEQGWQPLGDKIFMSTGISYHLVICCKFKKKKNSLKSDFIHFFHDFIQVCSLRTETESPQGTNFWCQQKGLITLPICSKFQRNLFENIYVNRNILSLGHLLQV